MRNLLKFLRPMAFLRRKAILAGVFGGSRKWLAWGGAAWVLHWLRSFFGQGEPTIRFAEKLAPGERVVVVHEPLSPLEKKKAARKERRRAAKAARRAT